MKQTSLRYKITRRVRSLPAQIGAWTLERLPIHRRLTAAYNKARAAHQPFLPTLSSFDRDIVAGLEEKGVYVTSLEALGLAGTPAMWDSATKIADAYRQRSARGEFAGEYTVQVEAEDLIRHPHIVRWALNDRILDIVETYVGLPAAYDTLNFFYTAVDDRQVGARRWHRDVEDRRMLKVIVYLHDVDLGTGPIEILHRPFSGSDKLEGTNFPVLTEEMLEQRTGGPLSECDVTTCTGPAGTVIFTDVASHYHRGRPAKTHDRCALFYNFFSRTPLRPFYCERHVFSRRQINELAHDLPDRARGCMLWHSTLPWSAKIVPRAPL